MRKTLLSVTLVAVLLASSLSAAAAPLTGTIVGGVRTHGSDLDPYVYLEANLVDNFALGVEHYHNRLDLSLWLGLNRGFYGEVNWANGLSSKPQSAELGLWSELDLSDRALVYGWVGAKRQLVGAGTTSLSLNAEAHLTLSGSVYLVVGGGVDLAQSASNTNGWLGIGYNF